MGVSHRRSIRKLTGGRIRRYRGKRRHEAGSMPVNTGISADDRHEVKLKGGRGGKAKAKVTNTKYANVTDQKTKKTRKARIITEKSNPANKNFARMNIITKGAMIETDIGMVRITSRPGQDGTVNAVLVEEKK